MLPNFSLDGKVAIVTGGRRSVGKAIALTFAEAGANVAVCDSTIEGGELAAVAEEIRRFGRRSLVIQTDVTRQPEVENLVQKVVDEFGSIDILVNNAGVARPYGLLNAPERDWDLVLDVNLKGCYLCSQAVGKRMVERKKGTIISMASMLGITGRFGGSAPYNISKAGVVMLTKVLALDLARFNIRVNAIGPGFTKTEMTRPLWDNAERLKQSETWVPLGRLAEPFEIASAALFLASDAASYITGHTPIVDGGIIA